MSFRQRLSLIIFITVAVPLTTQATAFPAPFLAILLAIAVLAEVLFLIPAGKDETP